ncbi:DUF4279 domain-containing protein [Variovorax sp. W6]|uniref:DUF4279 domain-containing protein n=1 Tax=Variovorax sp. W6 TaxID=3093895 RepID=UPI003D8012ED
MTRISTRTQKRLAHLRRRRQREKDRQAPARASSQHRFDASLRIAGVGAYHDEIFSRTGIASTHSHRKGELRGRSPALGCWTEDLWRLESPLGELATIDQHLEWLQAQIAPHKAYFAGLCARGEWADLCLGCLSESPYPVLRASPGALAMMKDLGLGLSFNFTCV